MKTLKAWKRMHEKHGHDVDVLEATSPGTHWHFVPRFTVDVCGLWAESGSIVKRLKVVQVDQFMNEVPIEVLCGPEPLKISSLNPSIRLEVHFDFATPVTMLCIATKRIG